MSDSDWEWLLPGDVQDYPWDCSAASTAWCLRAIGRDYSEQDVIAGLGGSRISPTYGLLDASGAGLVSYLAELGINAANNANASWTDIAVAGGFQPMVIGGRHWNHWVAVRMAGPCAGLDAERPLILMNPAPGWMGIGQYLLPADFDSLGPFSAVWFVSW